MVNYKQTVCLKCKKEFTTELDGSGIPYSKICPACKKNRASYGRGISGKI